MGQKQPIRETTKGSEIPDKLYFRIGDVAKLCDVPAYVLRFWESEFPQLKPNKGGTGQRLYRRRDVEMALKIKKLLYDEGFTIPGARQMLKGEARGTVPQLALAIDSAPAGSTPSVKDTRQLQKLKKELEELHALLSKPVTVVVPVPVHTIRAPRKVHSLAVASAAPKPEPGLGLFDLYPELDAADDHTDES